MIQLGRKKSREVPEGEKAPNPRSGSNSFLHPVFWEGLSNRSDLISQVWAVAAAFIKKIVAMLCPGTAVHK